MKITASPFTLNLRTTFRVAHGASDQRFNVLCQIDEGLGEAAVVPYYGDTQESILAYLRQLERLPGDDPSLLEDLLGNLPPAPVGDGKNPAHRSSQAARAAVDIALHDLWGKRLGQPLYRLFGLNPRRMPQTSYTIGIDEPEVMAERARQVDYPILKIKLGGPQDEAVLKALRSATNARLRVDANAGWTFEQAAALIPRLVQYDLEFIEQPLPRGDIEGVRRLRQQLHQAGIHIPIFVDESVKTSQDIAAHAGAVDGVVIKLMKTGGIREALRAIHTARALGMQVMLSCMVESSIGVTAAAHLAPLCDFVDLDGPLLIANDPYEGVTYQGANLTLPDRPGLGVVAK
jgi:L-alanine-DL-glutamate epimerase-like enolase superfamily enzyme